MQRPTLIGLLWRQLPVAIALILLDTSVVRSQQSGIGLSELRSLAGAANVDGSGVNLLHVEAEVGTPPVRNYSPDPANGQLTAKTFTDVGNPGQTSTGSNGHATGVGNDIYGSVTGTAPGIGNSGSPPINIHGAGDFINNELGSGNATPATQNYDVSNHSYVSTLSPPSGFDQAAAEDRLNRLDFVINEGNMTTVIGSSNSRNGALPAGFTHAYNTINVGVTDGGHAAGPTTFNGAGRNAIHVVVDRRLTSNATGIVSGAAAILHQTGAGTDAVRQEVIKATILAGATKDDLLDANRDSVAWNPAANQPLDSRYGAGELNVLNNHFIQQGGEVDGGSTSANAAATGLNGWDYEQALLANDERFYEFTVGPDESIEELSIALTWNLNVTNSSPFFGFTAQAETLADLSLQLFDASNVEIDISNSSVDNIEHIYQQNLAAGTYQIRVANLNGVATDYGLAFRGNTIAVSQIPEPSASALLGLVSLGLSTHRRRRP